MRDESIISLTKLLSGLGHGAIPVAEKADEVTPSIMSFRYIWKRPIFVKSSGRKVGLNSFSKDSASSAPTRYAIIVPTLPKIASCTISVICFTY